MLKSIINNVINNTMVQAVVEGVGKGIEITGYVGAGTAAITAPLLIPGNGIVPSLKLAAQGAAYIAAGKGIQKGVKKVQNNNKNNQTRVQHRKSDVDPELMEICVEEVVNLLAKGKRNEAIQMIYDEMYTDMWSPGMRRINSRDFVDRVEMTYLDIIEEMFKEINEIK